MTEVLVLGYGHYLVTSRTHPGEHYAISDGECTCRAAECGVRCWHLELIKQLQVATLKGIKERYVYQGFADRELPHPNGS